MRCHQRHQSEPPADEEGLEAERLRLYDVQWLDEPSLAQARIGEEALLKKHPGLPEAALGRWIRSNADIENVQVRGSTHASALLHSHNLVPDAGTAHAAALCHWHSSLQPVETAVDF